MNYVMPTRAISGYNHLALGLGEYSTRGMT